jgi:hypothetical protein
MVRSDRSTVQGTAFRWQIIILCVSWYTSFKLSLRDLVIMMADRGITLTHTTILRWVQRYLPEFEKRWSRYARPVRGSGHFEYNLNKTLGLVADFGGYANTRTGIDEKLLTYMFGPRFNWRHSRLNPYVQFLFGGGYVWSGPTSTTQNAFATAAGGGLDYSLTKRIAIKSIPVEYVMTQFDSARLGGATRGFGSHQNDVRYSAGVVFRFGEK